MTKLGAMHRALTFAMDEAAKKLYEGRVPSRMANFYFEAAPIEDGDDFDGTGGAASPSSASVSTAASAKEEEEKEAAAHNDPLGRVGITGPFQGGKFPESAEFLFSGLKIYHAGKDKNKSAKAEYEGRIQSFAQILNRSITAGDDLVKREGLTHWPVYQQILQGLQDNGFASLEDRLPVQEDIEKAFYVLRPGAHP